MIPMDHDFGWALLMLRLGARVARNGWNGKGMWLAMQRPDTNSKMTLPYIFIEYPAGHVAYPNGSKVPWLASQTDMLSNDWTALDEYDLASPIGREEAFQLAAGILWQHEKHLAGEIAMGCLHLKSGEPFFVLRAQDITAAEGVRSWIRMNEQNMPESKTEMAHEIARQMDRWTGPRKNPD